MYIRVTKEFNFEMAHALFGYDGPCKNIHGHSYKFSITFKGKPVANSSNSKAGMVIDFTDIKKLISTEIISSFDHALVLNKNTPVEIYSGLLNQKLILVDFQPTCENLLIHFVERLIKLVPPALSLHHLLLRETGTSYAEWYAEDNN